MINLKFQNLYEVGTNVDEGKKIIKDSGLAVEEKFMKFSGKTRDARENDFET